ncbi:hypothetical protein M514_12542 [Trichuris suis]|uniref:DDE-1 domain-containing protein n=1 Tax=Trichuris suis TaxID=68888 RepID=A0A085N6F9_9BILA|nr:hypothetical protein M513_12542 [Trichuris suis]KFD65055.1 hypothetical protein M514_12542 [Trichuris suis]
MDQGVIENLKRLYRKQLLRHLLLSEDKSVQSIIDFYSKTTLKDCCYMIAGSWSSVRQSTLRSSWKNILARRELSATSGASDPGEVVEEVLFNLNTLSLSGECQKADIEAWLACDSGNPGFQMLDDDEIAESVLNVEDEMDEDFDTQEAQVACPSHEKAFRCLEVALEWLEWQEECDPVKLLNLKSILEVAAKKRTASLKQTTITEYFKEK